MTRANTRKKPYSQHTDLEKIRKNWIKVRGFIRLKQWSGAIVRAATATEIAANLAIRQELVEIRGLDDEFVDHLLKWANGLQGKFDKLLIPVTRQDEWQPIFKQLRTRAADINTERNSIAHSGQFKKKSTATRVVKEARDIILTLVAPYYDGYDLPTINLD